MPNETPGGSWRTQVLSAIIIALLVGGSAPWWWTEAKGFFGKRPPAESTPKPETPPTGSKEKERPPERKRDVPPHSPKGSLPSNKTPPIYSGEKPEPPVAPRANRISNFRAEDASTAQLRITVDYDYTGDLGDDLIGGSLQYDGATVTAPFVHEMKHIKVGSDTATFTITKHQPDPAVVTTTAVQVCFDKRRRSTEQPRFCGVFPYTKVWKGFLPR